MKIGFAQINATVGDLSGNCELIIGAYERLAAAGAELVLTPELAITGYPPEDLLLRPAFVRAAEASLREIAKALVAAENPRIMAAAVAAEEVKAYEHHTAGLQYASNLADHSLRIG